MKGGSSSVTGAPLITKKEKARQFISTFLLSKHFTRIVFLFCVRPCPLPPLHQLLAASQLFNGPLVWSWKRNDKYMSWGRLGKDTTKTCLISCFFFLYCVYVTTMPLWCCKRRLLVTGGGNMVPRCSNTSNRNVDVFSLAVACYLGTPSWLMLGLYADSCRGCGGNGCAACMLVTFYSIVVLFCSSLFSFQSCLAFDFFFLFVTWSSTRSSTKSQSLLGRQLTNADTGWCMVAIQVKEEENTPGTQSITISFVVALLLFFFFQT